MREGCANGEEGGEPHCEAPPSYERSSEAHRALLAAEGVRRVGMKLARSLLLSAIAAFTVGVIALALGASLAALVLFVVSAVGFLATLVFLRRQ
jgi:hypothetical protein